MKPLSYFRNSKDLLDKSLRELSKLQKAIDNSDEREIGDCVFNFFITNYHIRDWLIQSDKIDKKTVDKYIKNSEWLRICRDLCNSGKHFIIDRGNPLAKTIHEPELPSVLLTGFDGNQVKVKNKRIEIHASNGKVYELLELAYQSFRAWELLFSDKSNTDTTKT